MPRSYTAGLAPYLVAQGDWIIRVTAIDPTDGSTVTGVNISNVSIAVDNLSGGDPSALDSGPFLLVQGPQQ